MNRKEIQKLEQIAYEMRKDVVFMGPRSGNVCHVGPALSCADIISALYFKIMNVDPANPHWDDRDRFVISKGHACIIVYSALARRGFFSMDELWNVKNVGSILQGHPDMKKTPGIDSTSGSLGNGMSVALGLALAQRYQRRTGRTYVVLGDGEAQEGIVWEAAMYAGSKKIDNLVVVLDYNHLQSGGTVEDILDMEPMIDKWKSFGWNVMEMDGHCMEEIVSKLEIAKHYYGKPTIIIAHTLKGKGVSFMEHNNAWHAKPMSDEECTAAIAELDEKLKAIAEEL